MNKHLLIRAVAPVILLLVALSSVGCRRVTPREDIRVYSICVGDLRLVIPREEAAIFRVGGTSLLRERYADIDTHSFGTDPETPFMALTSDGRELPGYFHLRREELEADRSLSKRTVIHPDQESGGELLGAPIGMTISPHESPAPSNPGRIMIARSTISDLVTLRLTFKSNRTGLEEIPAYLADLEDALIRWSSGQVLTEPDGVRTCPEVNQDEMMSAKQTL